MATSATIKGRLERKLMSLLAEIEFLPDVVATWVETPDSERASIALDWDHLMASYLTELDAAYRSGNLPADLCPRYRDLLTRLRNSLPLIEQLDFYRPPVSLDP